MIHRITRSRRFAFALIGSLAAVLAAVWLAAPSPALILILKPVVGPRCLHFRAPE